MKNLRPLGLAAVMKVLTFIVLSQFGNVEAANMRTQGAPDYMDADLDTKDVEKERQALGIKKGEFLALIYTEIEVKYNESQHIAKTVWGKCDEKIKAASETEAALEVKIGKATDADNVKDPVSGESAKMKWMDKRDNEKAEQVFYKQIIENAKVVLKESERGLREAKELRVDIQGFDKLQQLTTAYEAQVDDADEVLAEAKRLWKQYMDSSKDYNCGVPASVQHAEKQCEKGNTKFGIKCNVQCVPGYDDPNDSKNRLRCRKEGKFGKELYGEWKGMASCVGRMCGQPESIDKSKTVLQKIRFPHAATYNCYEGYSQDGDAKGPKAFEVPCGKTGNFEQNVSHVCQRIKCGDAPVHAGTEKVDGTYLFSDSITYNCKTGYTLDETPGGLKEFPVSCQATGRFTQGHDCKRVRCGTAPDYDDTTASRVTAQGEKYYGDIIDYKCQPGYSTDQKPSGPSKFTLTCSASGEFVVKGSSGNVPLPQCRAVSAGVLPEIANGNAKRREMFYGETVIVTADLGYSTTGKATEGTRFTVSVTTEGTFDGLKTFQPVSCGPPPSVMKAGAEKGTTTSKNGVFGDVIPYHCEDGYSTDANDADSTKVFTLQCEADGDYSKVDNLGKCVNIDDCVGHSCGPHGDCVDHLMNYTCSCQSGFEQTVDKDTGDLVCGNINDCGAEACGVGTCKDLVNGYDCICPTGHKVVGEAEEKTCAPKECGIPPEVSHAATTPLDVGTQKAVYQDKIVYKCDSGYTQSGKFGGKNHFSIDCQADRSFTATESCKAIECGDGPKVDKASVNPASATFNDTLRYNCEDGYTIDGTPDGDGGFTLTCLVNGKYGDASQCKPVNCGEPDELPSASRPDGSLVYKQAATYKCFDGFTLDGDKNGPTEFKVKCNADGSLDKLKTCLPKVCGVPHKHINALHATTADEGAVAYPRSTEVTCRDGFTVGGSPGGNSSFNVECLATGEFDSYNKRECEPVRCGAPPSMPNATLDRVESPHKHEDKDNLNFEEKAFYKCLPGFSTGGEPSAPKVFKVECLANGELSAPADDMQCRNINDCERHTCGPKGTCIDLIGPSPAYTCECAYGFDLRTKPNGEKHCGNTDNCKDQDCGVGTCKDLIGDYTCICPSGYFIGKDDGVKTCVPVTCSDDTPSLDHGKQTTDHSGRIDFPTTLQYKCDVGYSIDGSAADSKRRFQAQCKPNGQLAGMMSCQKISCGTPRVLPFTKLDSHTPRNSIEYDEEVKYSCDNGYTVGGKPDGATKFSVKCPDNGVLTDPEVCEPVYCGKAPRVPHSRAAISGDVFFGMHLEYNCDTGFTLDKSASGATKFERTCKKDGSFSDLPSAQPCKAIYGGKAPTIENAEMTEYAGSPVTNFPPEIYYPNGLEYRCKPGYSENGSPSGRTKLSTRVNSLGNLQPALPGKCMAITFTIRGRVKDARNGQGVNGWVQVVGTSRKVQAIGGLFAISGIRSGLVKLSYTNGGYISSTKLLDIHADIPTGGGADTSMSPVMRDDEWRAVVLWGKKPSDLDTYGKFGNTKVCYYSLNRWSYRMKGVLEHDDTSSYGPETLYMKGIGNCIGNDEKCAFKYQINDYGRNGNMKDVSEAEVTLYNGNRVAGRWKIADCKNTVSRDGNWWHVFTVDGKRNKVSWACDQGQGGSDYKPSSFLADPTPMKGPAKNLTFKASNTSAVANVHSELKTVALEEHLAVHTKLRPSVAYL